MYHLIKLLKLSSSSKIINNELIAGNDQKLIDSTDSHIKKTLLIYGILETIPFIAGLVLSFLIDNIIFHFDYLIFGLSFSVILALLFNSKIPDTPIGLKK
jgi:hypothetical protein